MRRKKSTPTRRKRRPGPASRPGRSHALDRWAATLAPTTIAALFVCVLVGYLDPGTPKSYIYQVVLVLCLLIAAAGGRALVGFKGSADGEPAQPKAGTRLLLPLAVVAAASLPYLHGLTIGFLADDFVLAASAGGAASPAEAMSSPVFRLFYRPATLLIWWLGMRLGDAAPLALGILCLATHILNSLLVYAIGRRVIGSLYGAALGAMLFAVHPLHVEPVLWRCCLSDLICTAFCLLSLLCLEIYLASPARRRGVLAIAAGSAALLLALLTKEAALALPGFVILRLALARTDRLSWRSLASAVPYVVTLGIYLVLRFATFHQLGGYPVSLQSWHTWLPAQALRQIGTFLFPVHTALFSQAMGPYLRAAAIALMAAGVVWWSRGLPYVPVRRLCLWLGFVFIMAVPVSLFGSVTTLLVDSRFAYLPTIGLAWLFGDLCAGRGARWRRSGAAAAAIILTAALLSVWYTAPWRAAGRLTRSILSATDRVVDDLPGPPGDAVLYVRDLPLRYVNAPVFNTGFAEAVRLRVPRVSAAYTVLPIRDIIGQGPGSRIDPDVLDWSVLSPGEYVVAWRPASERMEILVVGASPRAEAAPGGAP
jgi:hypothetical protein